MAEEATSEDVFPGFWHPMEASRNVSGFSMMQHVFIEQLSKIDSLAELKIILYIMRHTWGYLEIDNGEGVLWAKKITVDEFMYGRKRKDKTRMDHGTGLSSWGVQKGIELALKHKYILQVVDDSDKARIEKSYCLNIRVTPEELKAE